MSFSRMSYDPPGDRPASLFLSNDSTGDKRSTSLASVIGVCLGVLLLPCVAVGAYWAVITFIDGANF